MIKCTINKEINGVNFKIIYITQQYNLYSFFAIPNRDYFYVIVNLENRSVLKESREFGNLSEFSIDNLMNDYLSKQTQLPVNGAVSMASQELSAY